MPSLGSILSPPQRRDDDRRFPGMVSATFPLAITAGSSPAIQLSTVPTDCDQGALPDAQRLQLLRSPAVHTAGVASPVLVLVHGWQFLDWTCSDAGQFNYASDATWSGIIGSAFPATGNGIITRLQEYEVWSYRYLSNASVPTLGADLARLLSASQFSNRKIVILAHSKGGLVAGSATVALPSAQVAGIVTVGTPWPRYAARRCGRRSRWEPVFCLWLQPLFDALSLQIISASDRAAV